MVMNPRTHPRGAAPDFQLPRPNPNPDRMTDALWWYVCMCEALEPKLTQNGGTYANKPGYHNIGNNLPDHGLGNPDTDHSIRRAPDRRGPWWRTKTSAHDWTFFDAQRGDYKTINKYMKRLVGSMKSLSDTRLDDVYAYVIGQLDGDVKVEGWNEYRDAPETGDSSHLWHIHKSFRRDIIGSFPHMWKSLTVVMGWTYAEWQRSVSGEAQPEKEIEVPFADEKIKITEQVAAELFSAPTKAGDEKSAATMLMLSALWAARGAKNTDTLETAASKLDSNAQTLIELSQKLDARLGAVEEWVAKVGDNTTDPQEVVRTLRALWGPERARVVGQLLTQQ